MIVQNYDPRQVDNPDVDKVALSPSDTAQNVTNLGHENQFSFALDNYNLGEMNTGSAAQDAAYINANRNNPTTQAKIKGTGNFKTG